MKLSIEMALDNDAMQEHDDDGMANGQPSGRAISEIFNTLSAKFADYAPSTGKIKDANGNIIGEWSITDD